MSGNFWLKECKKEEHPCNDANVDITYTPQDNTVFTLNTGGYDNVEVASPNGNTTCIINDGIINPDVVEGTFENCTTTGTTLAIDTSDNVTTSTTTNSNTWAWDVACSEDEVDSNVELADASEITTDEAIGQDIRCLLQEEVVLLSEEMAELREKNFCGYAAKVRKSLNQTLREYSNEGVLRDPLVVFAPCVESICLRVKYKIRAKDTSFVIGI